MLNQWICIICFSCGQWYYNSVHVAYLLSNYFRNGNPILNFLFKMHFFFPLVKMFIIKCQWGRENSRRDSTRRASGLEDWILTNYSFHGLMELFLPLLSSFFLTWPASMNMVCRFDIQKVSLYLLISMMYSCNFMPHISVFILSSKSSHFTL